MQSTTIPTQFSGSVTKRSRKPWLQQLAHSLSLSAEGKNEDLASRINNHLKEHSELYEDQKYTGLMSYRTERLSGGKGNKTGKTSADKDREDGTEADKAAKVSGAAKTLKILGTPVDPPGHARPGGSGSRPPKTSHKDEVHSSENELSDSSIDGLGEESEGTPIGTDTPKTPKKTAKILGHADIMARPLIVYIHKYGSPINVPAAPEAVYLMPKEAYTIVQRHINHDPQAPMEYVARLSEILPDVIEDNSPMKARAGRLYRQIENIGQPVNFAYLGDVATILRGESKKLRLDFLNDIVLDAESVPGKFVCNVWCSDPTEPEKLVPVDANPSPIESNTQAIKIAVPPPTTQGLKDFRNLSAEDALEFIDALKEFFGEPENRVWPRAEKMKDIVVRRRAVLNALEILESKGCTNRRSGGGFLIGDWELEVNGHDEPWKFANMKFTQAQVEQALELKHTKAQEDRNLFHPDTLHRYPKIAAWLDDPDGEYADRFSDMTVKAFIAYKNNIDSRTTAKLKNSAKVSKKKGRGSDDKNDTDDSDEEEERVRLKKRKGKARAINSDDLDD